MRRRLLFLLCIVLLAGCSLFEAQQVEQQEEIPKSYTLAIGYANEAKWSQAMEQLLKTINDADANVTFKQAALYIYIHLLNGELTAYEQLNDNASFAALVADNQTYYEQLLDVEGVVDYESFLGLNYNVNPIAQETMTEQEQQLFKEMSTYIVTHWSVIFNRNPIDMKMLLEQAADAINAVDEELALQLTEKAATFE